MTLSMRTLLRMTACASMLATAGAQAVDWGGYFRVGPGATTTKGASRACYSLGVAGLKWRLGNECDFYGEFALSQNFKSGGVDYKATLMTDMYEATTDGNTGKLGINQMYVEATGYDVAPQTTFWTGKRYHGRQDVYVVDTHFTNLSGVGAGLDTPLGRARLGLSYFKTDKNATDSGNRINVDVHDIPANPGGKLRFVGTFVDARFSAGPSTTAGKNGLGLIAMHMQDNFLGWGGSNTLWLQYAQGSAGLDGNFGTLTDDSRAKRWRVVESFIWQTGGFSGQAMALWEQDKTPDATTGALARQTDLSVGARAVYAFTRNFKLVAEAGHSQIRPDGQDTKKLTKLSIAPTLTTGPGFWDRPEIRLYVTQARWNHAAGGSGAVDAVTGQAAFAGKTSGTSFGVQVATAF